MAKLILNSEGKEKTFLFDKAMRIGRSKDNDVVLNNLSVSRNHARIRYEDGRYILVDLNSANGTQVNGVRITKTEVVDGDRVSIGKQELTFRERDTESPASDTNAIDIDRTMMMDVSAAKYYVTLQKGKKSDRFEVARIETTIGRAAACDIRLPDLFAAKKHALLLRQGAGYYLRVLGGLRGTSLNDRTVKESDGPQPLKAGDKIKIGSCLLTLHKDEEPSEPAAAPFSRAVPSEFDAIDDPPDRPESATPPPAEPAAEPAAAAAAFDRMEADFADHTKPTPAVQPAQFQRPIDESLDDIYIPAAHEPPPPESASDVLEYASDDAEQAELAAQLSQPEEDGLDALTNAADHDPTDPAGKFIDDFVSGAEELAQKSAQVIPAKDRGAAAFDAFAPLTTTGDEEEEVDRTFAIPSATSQDQPLADPEEGTAPMAAQWIEDATVAHSPAGANATPLPPAVEAVAEAPVEADDEEAALNLEPAENAAEEEPSSDAAPAAETAAADDAEVEEDELDDDSFEDIDQLAPADEAASAPAATDATADADGVDALNAVADEEEEPLALEPGELLASEDEEPADEEEPAPSTAEDVPDGEGPEDGAAAAAEPPAAAEDAGPNAAEIALWEKALENPSQAIRKEAKRRLKELTGKEYD